MESSPSALLKLLVPKTPFILKTALWHTLYLSDTSSKWDLRTELTIKILRNMLGPDSPSSSITKQQRLTTKDPGVKGKMWVSKVQFPADEDGEGGLRDVLFSAIEAMKGDASAAADYTKPPVHPLEAEWTGYRAGVPDNEPEPPNLSEKEKFEHLMKETTSKVTLLYFHGGAMYLLDPATYRPITSRLAKESGGRVLSVRYRLSPQHPFPAALLDALTAYLSLLYPPAGSPHAPVPADEIVFGGDSAGGMACTALLQLLLHLHRSAPPGQTPKVRFHGHDVEVPLPAGLALTSPWFDTTRGLPSIEGLAHFDYLPPPSHTAGMRFPPCEAWPEKPPRAEIYCEGSALVHPLVSPLAARDWTGCPPLFISVGQEMLRDENTVLAQRVARQGGVVVWREFEAMPHCFAMMLEALPSAKIHCEEYGRFCKEAVEGKAESNGEVVAAKTMVKSEVDVKNLTELTDDKVDEYMQLAKERIIKRFVERSGDPSAQARPML